MTNVRRSPLKKDIGNLGKDVYVEGECVNEAIKHLEDIRENAETLIEGFEEFGSKLDEAKELAENFNQLKKDLEDDRKLRDACVYQTCYRIVLARQVAFLILVVIIDVLLVLASLFFKEQFEYIQLVAGFIGITSLVPAAEKLINKDKREEKAQRLQERMYETPKRSSGN